MRRRSFACRAGGAAKGMSVAVEKLAEEQAKLTRTVEGINVR
jgi:hypothetical protein